MFDFDYNKTISDLKRVFIYIAIIGSMINIPLLFTPMYTMQIFDRVISTGSLDTLLMLSIMAFFANFVYCFLYYVRNLVAFAVSSWLNKVVYRNLMSKSLKLKLVDNSISVSQVMRDIEVVKSFLNNPLVMSVIDAPWAVIFLLIMFFINKFCALITLISVISTVLLGILNDRISGKILKDSNVLQINTLRSIEFASRNFDAIEAMGMNASVVNSWYSTLISMFEIQRKTQFRSGSLDMVIRFVKTSLSMSIMGIGSLCVIKYPSSYGMGGVIACSIMMGRVLAPCDAFWASWKIFVSASESYMRLRSIHLSSNLEYYKTPLDIKGDSLSVNDLTYTPSKSNISILDKIDFTVNAGEILLLIGSSGSGKTTLLKTIAGILKPTQGSVRVDGADMFKLNKEESSKFIGYLSQNPELFDDTVINNIARMSVNPDMNLIVESAKAVGIHEKILSLPNGYDTVIGQYSNILSGGQKKQIAIARALYASKLSLIIFDEPTANLDSESEMLLIHLMQRLQKRNIIIILSTHNRALISIATKILLLQSGRVGFFGMQPDFIELINRNSNSSQQREAGSNLAESEAA